MQQFSEVWTEKKNWTKNFLRSLIQMKNSHVAFQMHIPYTLSKYIQIGNEFVNEW